MKKHILIFFTYFLLVPFSCLHLQAEEISIPMPPEFVPALNQDGYPRYMQAPDMEHLFRTYSKNLGAVVFNHNIKNFILPDENWLYAFLDSFEEYLRSQHIRPEHDTWDCENYSTLLNSFASIRLWRAGYTDTRLAMGWMRVQARYQWAGIPDAIHALVFAVTSGDVLVIEPQNGQTIPLKDYPNKEFIEEVYLF